MTCGCGRVHTQGGLHVNINATGRIDPTRTTMLRRKLAGQMTLRFRKLKGDILRRLELQPVTSTDQVGAFMVWLQTRIDRLILGEESVSRARPVVNLNLEGGPTWMQTVLDMAFRAGMEQAVAKLEPFMPDMLSAVALARKQAIQRRQEAIQSRAYEDLKNVTSAMATSIRRELLDGIDQGLSTKDIARLLNSRVDAIGTTRARLIARTEVVRAHHKAALAVYREAEIDGVDVEVEWLTAADPCPICVGLRDGGPYTLDEAEGLLPAHPNCLPGDSLVLSRTGVTNAFKRWFNGEVVVIKTASGLELTSTPNHPILTDGGWVASGAIDLGSKVVCDGGREWVGVGNGDDNNVIPSIHDVTEAFFRSSKVAPVPVPVSAEHFHGDGAGSKVAVIGANRLLRDDVGNAALQHAVDDMPLKFGIKNALRFLGLGGLAENFLGLFRATNSRVRFAGLIDSRFGAHSGPLDGLRIGLTSHLDATPNESPFDSAPADAKLARDLIAGVAGKVFLDDVVSVEVKAFSGHVYNLETGGGWYSANGIITHNCRCALAPRVKRPT